VFWNRIALWPKLCLVDMPMSQSNHFFIYFLQGKQRMRVHLAPVSSAIYSRSWSVLAEKGNPRAYISSRLLASSSLQYVAASSSMVEEEKNGGTMDRECRKGSDLWRGIENSEAMDAQFLNCRLYMTISSAWRRQYRDTILSQFHRTNAMLRSDDIYQNS